VRKDTFEQIPQPLQLTILESFQRHLDQLKTVTRNENRDATKVMVKNGVKIITPSREQLDEFKKLANKAMSHPRSQSFSKNVLEEVTSYLEGYRRGGK
ncbi:MAG: hypothetical protein ACXU99_06405, partial [Thermodesulfobacteriota bacterium]